SRSPRPRRSPILGVGSRSSIAPFHGGTRGPRPSPRAAGPLTTILLNYREPELPGMSAAGGEGRVYGVTPGGSDLGYPRLSGGLAGTARLNYRRGLVIRPPSGRRAPRPGGFGRSIRPRRRASRRASAGRRAPSFRVVKDPRAAGGPGPGA